MTTTTNSGAVEAGVGGTKSPAPTALALYRHALDLCERLGLGRPMSLHHWAWGDPPMTVYVWPDEWRPEWGGLRVSAEQPDVAKGTATVEGVLFLCVCPLYQAAELGIVEGA